MNALWEEITHAVYRIRWNKVLTGFKLGLLAIGLGCCVSIFTIYNSVLLRSLPYPNSDHIFVMGQSDETRPPDYLTATNYYCHKEIRNRINDFELVGHYNWYNGTFKTDDYIENIHGYGVSPEIFEILGSKPEIGRTITRESTDNGRIRAVVINHLLWERAFGADPSAIGKIISINDHSYELIGVMSSSFRFIYDFPGEHSTFWTVQLEEDIPAKNKKSRWYPTLALYKGKKRRRVPERTLRNRGGNAGSLSRVHGAEGYPHQDSQ